jgi:hypothetical protein
MNIKDQSCQTGFRDHIETCIPITAIDIINAQIYYAARCKVNELDRNSFLCHLLLQMEREVGTVTRFKRRFWISPLNSSPENRYSYVSFA